MPRVKQVTARKDYPNFGIAKGQVHYYWTLMTSPRSSRTFRQVAPPRPSQLTSSAFLGAVGDLEHDLSAMTRDDGLPDLLHEMANTIRELAAEEQEKYDNMPEGLQAGPTGEMLSERSSNAETWADSIEEAAETLTGEIDEIKNKQWFELDIYSHLDPEDADFDPADKPDEVDVDSARDEELNDAYDKAISEVEDNNPGF